MSLLIVSLPLIMLTAVLARWAAPPSRFADYEPTLKRILADKDIIASAKADPGVVQTIVRNVLDAVPAPPARPPTRSFITKISEDITWDVAGLIGIGVTAVILIMMVSGKKADIPEAIIAGWTTILGFYFGRASATS
jgi:hypothetical protein